MQKRLCNCCLANELRFQGKKGEFWDTEGVRPVWHLGGLHTLASVLCDGARRELRGFSVSPWMSFKVGQEGTLGDEQHLLELLSAG